MSKSTTVAAATLASVDGRWLVPIHLRKDAAMRILGDVADSEMPCRYEG
jgi:hypothetical protein